MTGHAADLAWASNPATPVTVRGVVMTDATTTETTFAAALTDRRNGAPVIVPHVVGGQQRLDGPQVTREDPINPANVVTGCHEAPAELVKLAVDCSRAAQREWAQVPLAERADRVRRGIDYVI